MTIYVTKEVEVEVEVDLDDLDTQDLIDELKERNIEVASNHNDKLYYWLRDQRDVPQFVRDWCWEIFGRTW